MAEYLRREIAKELGIGNETLRYYEKIGIIPKPKRTDSSYRVYNDTDLLRLKFIKRLKALGFSLNEIQTVMQMLNRDNAVNNEILKNRISMKLEEIDQRISALKELKEMLNLSGSHLGKEECGLLKFVSQTDKDY
jgi:DNA-binding transcriptional MerR regulator